MIFVMLIIVMLKIRWNILYFEIFLVGIFRFGVVNEIDVVREIFFFLEIVFILLICY